MANKWWGSKDLKSEGEEEEREIEFKAPKEFTEKLSKIDGLETSLSEVKSKFSVLDRMDSFLQEQDAAKAAARAEKAKEMAKTASATLEDKWIENPQEAFNEASAPLKASIINAHSMNIRREIFDDAQEFEYYTGDFKKEVDNLIDTSLPATSKADPASIKNCYYLVLGRKQKEIREGKLKSKFASTSTSSAKGSEGPEGAKKEIQLTDEQKRAADKLGVPHDKYAANLGDLAYV